MPIRFDSPYFRLLEDLGLSSRDSFSEYHPRTRDREDVKVLRCSRSGVLALDSVAHLAISHYEKMKGFDYWGAEDRARALLQTRDDDERRARNYACLIRGKDWLDVGTGNGGLLDLLQSQAASLAAIEPQREMREVLGALGYRVFADSESAPEKGFDVITLFHVFEHLLDPIGELERLARRLRPGGVLIVEVPHARDALLGWFDLPAFKDFTFWSEHLILHTRESLKRFIQSGGFEEPVIEGFQRYPLANHLRWLSAGKPGGHLDWPMFRASDVEAGYANLLRGLDMTDTLIACARRA